MKLVLLYGGRLVVKLVLLYEGLDSEAGVACTGGVSK